MTKYDITELKINIRNYYVNVFLTTFQSKKVMTADIRPSEQLTRCPPVLLSPAPKLSAICLNEVPTFLHCSTSLWLVVTRLVSTLSGGGGPSVFLPGLSSTCFLLVDLLELLALLGLLLLSVRSGRAGTIECEGWR